MHYTKKEDQQQRVGWSSTVDLYTQEDGYERITFLSGSTVHFASVDTAGRYRVKKSPYYELDISIIADLERFFVSLEKAAAGEGGSETIHRHYNLQLASICPLPNLSIF